MVEPHIGHERDYNRWYEDDHMFSGALYLPWMFSGRRWVAPYDLQQMRYPRDGKGLFTPITKGCYLSTYWITPGRLEVHKEWSFSVYSRLVAEGRVNEHREHVFTSFQDKAGTVYQNAKVPRDVFTLLDPSPGLVVEIVDADAEDGEELREWLLTKHIPARVMADNTVSSAMVFSPRGPEPLSAEVMQRVGKISGIADDRRRVTVLWFLEKDPREEGVWSFFTAEDEVVRKGNLGKVTFCAPFIPARMGTNTYDDLLRGPAQKI
jgi:hypothetical protein